jgi:ribosomal protein L16 Arg81 hydroxylase
MFIIDDLLIKLPAKGFLALCKKIQQLVDEELNDESKLKEQLLHLQTKYELNQISEEEYYKQEDEIMLRLNEARERKKVS